MQDFHWNLLTTEPKVPVILAELHLTCSSQCINYMKMQGPIGSKEQSNLKPTTIKINELVTNLL